MLSQIVARGRRVRVERGQRRLALLQAGEVQA